MIYNEVSSFLKNKKNRKNKKNNKLTDEVHAHIKSAFLSALVRSYAISGKRKRTLRFYNKLSEFRTRFPFNKSIRVAWTFASPLVPPFYATNKQIEIEKARKIYDDSVNLNSVYSEDKSFLKSLCVTSANMIIVYGRAKEVKEARAIYDKLVGLTEEHLGKQNRIKRVIPKRLVRCVRKLAGRAGLRETKLSMAAGCVSMIAVYAQAGRVDEARNVHDKLEALASKNSEDEKLQRELAKGSFNMMSAYEQARRAKEARGGL